MSTFPGSPRVVKGAIVGIDPVNPLASVIVFQYNPDTLSRSLTAQTVGGGAGSRVEPMRLKGAPVETIGLKVEIDAADQLESADSLTLANGIYPQLSALEMLLYPKSAFVIANAALLRAGTMEVVPPEAPLTLFIWGLRRIVPVRLTAFTIAEEAYDVNLNPTRASATLSLRVLSYSDLPQGHPGYALFLSHQVVKEAMATIGSVRNISAVAGGRVSLTGGNLSLTGGA